MASRANYVKIGLFVIFGLSASLGLAVALGAANSHHDTVQFYTFFNESVQGLEIGAPVTFRGVRMGRVGDITIAPDHRLVEVRMDVDVQAMEQLGLVPRGEFKQRGTVPPPPDDLRTQVGSQGLTGNKYVSIDFFDAKSHPPPELPFPTPEHYVPSTLSLTKGLEDSLANAMEQVTTLAQRATYVVDGVGHVVDDLDHGRAGEKATNALAEAQAALKGVDHLVGSANRAKLAEQAGGMIEQLHATAGDLDKIFTNLDGDKGLLATAKGSLASFGEAGRNVAGATRDLDQTLGDIREAAASVRALADEIERQPDALLKGRARGAP